MRPTFGAAVLVVLGLAAGCVLVVEKDENNRNRGNSGNTPAASNPPPQNDPPRRSHKDHSHLPDMGLIDRALPASMQGEVFLQRGRFHVRNDRLKLRNGRLTIIGAGIGETVIEGDIDAKGDGYVFKQLTVTGDFELHGNNCVLAVKVEGKKDVGGANHQFGPGW